MEDLIKTLRKFDEIRTAKKNISWDVNEVARCFMPCAEEILCKGYFLLNKKYIIDIGSIELYYHEEEGEIKDYIMYHTNEHPSKARIFRLKGKYPYFEFGSFNLHQSGVDVTFEKPNEYRASFLIRSYRLLEAQDGEYPTDDDTKYDLCSTHLFDDMFYKGIVFGTSENATKIEWKKTDKKGKIMDEPTIRTNVSMYHIKDDKLEKLTIEDYMRKHMCLQEEKGLAIETQEVDNSETEVTTFKSGKKTYVQDPRKWQFRLKDIK